MLFFYNRSDLEIFRCMKKTDCILTSGAKSEKTDTAHGNESEGINLNEQIGSGSKLIVLFVMCMCERFFSLCQKPEGYLKST